MFQEGVVDADSFAVVFVGVAYAVAGFGFFKGLKVFAWDFSEDLLEGAHVLAAWKRDIRVYDAVLHDCQQEETG